MPSSNDRLEKNREYIRSRKRVPCADCGGNFPEICMDFHHLNEETKLDHIQKRGRNRSMTWTLCKYSKQKIDEEINKCVVLCSNCHRIRHSTT
jgi:hypothetical protein